MIVLLRLSLFLLLSLGLAQASETVRAEDIRGLELITVIKSGGKLENLIAGSNYLRLVDANQDPYDDELFFFDVDKNHKGIRLETLTYGDLVQEESLINKSSLHRTILPMGPKMRDQLAKTLNYVSAHREWTEGYSLTEQNVAHYMARLLFSSGFNVDRSAGTSSALAGLLRARLQTPFLDIKESFGDDDLPKVEVPRKLYGLCGLSCKETYLQFIKQTGKNEAWASLHQNAKKNYEQLERQNLIDRKFNQKAKFKIRLLTEDANVRNNLSWML